MLRLAPKSDRIQLALEHARRNLAQPLSVEELAQAAKLSPRQFSRVFTAETGQSPAKAVERLRLEAARLMIEGSRHPLEVVARKRAFATGATCARPSCAASACRRRRCGAGADDALTRHPVRHGRAPHSP